MRTKTDKPPTPLQIARRDYPVSLTDVKKHYSQWPSKVVRRFCPEPDFRSHKECRWQTMPVIVVPYVVVGHDPAQLQVKRWTPEAVAIFSHESREYINNLLLRFVHAAWEFPRKGKDWMTRLFNMLDQQMRKETPDIHDIGNLTA